MDEGGTSITSLQHEVARLEQQLAAERQRAQHLEQQRHHATAPRSSAAPGTPPRVSGFYDALSFLPEALLTTNTDHEVHFANAPAARLLHRERPEDLIGAPVPFEWPGAKSGAHAESTYHLVHHQVESEASPRALEVLRAPLELDDEVVYLWVLRDATVREEIELALSETQALFYTVFQAAPVAASITRLADGIILDVNDRVCEILGYSREEIIGSTGFDLGFWDTPERFGQLRSQLEQEGAIFDLVFDGYSRDGEKHTYIGSFQRINVDGEPCMLAFVTDISTQKQAEERLVYAKEQAMEMARLRTTFLTNVTHEIRTPLTVIIGFTSMLKQGVRPEYQRFVNVIDRSGRRLLRMLDSVLDLAQLESGTLATHYEPFNIGDVVHAVTESMRPLAEEKGLSLDVEFPDEHVYAVFDHEILSRVMSNLIDNAIKFTEEGRVVVSVEVNDDMVYLKVKDTGIGIDEAFLPHVFDEFAQESTGLSRTHQGTGLGLSVSKRLVELLGGSIHVETRKGQGSVFTIRCPSAVEVG